MIYRCIPRNVSRIWGSLPPERAGEEPVGEVWWFCDTTILESESGSRRKAHDFFPLNSFPIIIKTLHASMDLSVQVHPGKDRTPPMKDESWVVLQGFGKIIHGIRSGVSPAQFRSALEFGTVDSVLQKIDAEPGVFVHLPAGTVHALGSGLTVLEVQLNCSITYRLWDYGRKDIHGNTREIHIDQGLSAVNWETMGRAREVFGDSLEADFYSMLKLGGEEIEMGPFELAFIPAVEKCFFSDGDGGRLVTGSTTWLVRM